MYLILRKRKLFRKGSQENQKKRVRGQEAGIPVWIPAADQEVTATPVEVTGHLLEVIQGQGAEADGPIAHLHMTPDTQDPTQGQGQGHDPGEDTALVLHTAVTLTTVDQDPVHQGHIQVHDHVQDPGLIDLTQGAEVGVLVIQGHDQGHTDVQDLGIVLALIVIHQGILIHQTQKVPRSIIEYAVVT